jgi:hypothetical protein
MRGEPGAFVEQTIHAPTKRSVWGLLVAPRTIGRLSPWARRRENRLKTSNYLWQLLLCSGTTALGLGCGAALEPETRSEALTVVPTLHTTLDNAAAVTAPLLGPGGISHWPYYLSAHLGGGASLTPGHRGLDLLSPGRH